MIEKKFVAMMKREFDAKEFIKKTLGKGKISSVGIELTPVGEKITITSAMPGLVIGKRGETIIGLTETIKKHFGFENPHIEILEIEKPELDAQSVADSIAINLEKRRSSSFKSIAYQFLERIRNAGAQGAEIILGGKLPGEKARSWAFRFGSMIKVGEQRVKWAKARAETSPGTTGVKVAIWNKEKEKTEEENKKQE